jgi:CSLREA domain-containing protein
MHTVRAGFTTAVAAVILLLAALLAGAPAASAAETFTVTTTADESGECLPTQCSLREAVEAANEAAEPSTIVVPAGEYLLTEAEEGSDLTIENGVTINGAGAGVTKIRQGAECDCRVLYVDGSNSVTISGVTIAGGDVIENPRGPDGGDILYENGGTLRLERDVITEGAAEGAGGGIAANEGQLELLESTVSGNRALLGGGLFIEYDSSEAVTIERDTFVGNEAFEAGGAIAIELGNVFVTNSTFTQNQAGAGGAIATGEEAYLSLLNDTLAGDSTVANTFGAHGASGHAFAVPSVNSLTRGAELDDTSLGSLSVVNTIVGPAGEGQAGHECFLDAIETSEANIDAGESCNFEGGSLQNTDPQLEALASNGGPTQTLALRVTSPAINTANGSACPAIDQRGVTRPQGAGCDIGAYEYVFPTPTPPVTPATTPTTPSTPAPAPKVEVKSVRAHLAVVHARIAATGLPTSCTRSGLHLHLRVALSPRSLASRRVHGRPLVRVHVVVKLDGRRIKSSHKRSFSLNIPLGDFGVGHNTLTVIATSAGKGVRRARRVRRLRFSRCLPAAVFTG